MFNKEEIEKLKAECESYKSQLELKEMQLEQLQKKYEHKHNELIDTISSAFFSFRKMIEMTERNDYGDPQQKVRQLKEYAEEQRNYYAQLTISKPIKLKNRTTITNQSNK